MNEKNQNNVSESEILKLEMDLGKLTKDKLSALVEKLGKPLPFKSWEQKKVKKNELIRLITMRVKRSEIPLNKIKDLIINEL
ncbi:MAG: hypothetical protein KKA79_08365, partial [Nanoarchaeota archaeon]|nr:hypothetical protein [Nanoarchaeota archaeon]